MFIRGRKKEMIVTPEGLNVFPEDVERALQHVPGVRDSAVVGIATGGEERVHAVLVVDPGVDPDAVVAGGERRSSKIIRRSGARVVWPEPELPRTEGTRKLKRAAIREWLRTGAAPRAAAGDGDKLSALVAKYAGRADLASTTTLEELGLSSLERVELMVALEDAFQTHLDEGAFAGVRDVGQLRTLVERRGHRRHAAGRAGRLPDLEPIARGAGDPPHQPADLDPAAGPRVRLAAHRGSRASRADPRTGDLCRQSPEPSGRAGRSWRRCRRVGDTGWRRRWRRSFSRRTSSPSSTDASHGSPTV